ncbi:hypothetical protein M422DRAFT_257481 [Sphaerobolus stellatus SS14]|uniref:Unplaced genomic scaffold SPHSTscaffold_75, whole genome shotgun sequence n=1 Tax=Sphaerobolus stellatus (strain SS14) TaxID=990650 RepID=A0A0C9UXN4_SPHS4|nr:hypothetical protein M422DRAFT_257481 [Sphaerobolus stellatus SS14]
MAQMSMLNTNDVTVLYSQAFGLSKMELGHALWDADHPAPEIAPEIGSIGFVYRGKWVQIAKLEDPEIHRNILKGSIKADEPLRGSNVQVRKLSVDSSFALGPTIGPADSRDASNVLYFKKLMCQNYRKWYEKARFEDHFDVDLHEIILVAGCHYANNWANAVMKANTREAEVTIAVGGAGFAEGRFSAAITDSGPTSNLFRKNWGPTESALWESRSTDFVRGCKVVTRGWINTLRQKKFKKLLITDAMHLCEPQESKTDMYSSVFASDDESSDDEDADHHRPLSKKSRTSSASSRLFSWFSSSHRSKASTYASCFSEEPKLGMYENVWDELSDPLSVVLLYILQPDHGPHLEHGCRNSDRPPPTSDAQEKSGRFWTAWTCPDFFNRFTDEDLSGLCLPRQLGPIGSENTMNERDATGLSAMSVSWRQSQSLGCHAIAVEGPLDVPK